MPGPAHWRGLRALKAFNQGDLKQSDIEKAAFNVLKLVHRTKGLSGPAEPPEQSIDNADTRALIREAAAQGITLLKNDKRILPIKNVKKIAIIGPNANRAVVGGGGSSTLNPYYTLNPYEGIKAATDAELLYAQGCDSTKWLPLASEYCIADNGHEGVILEYYHGDQFEGEPVSVQHKATTDLFLWDSAPKSVLPAYSFKVKTTLTPRTSGSHMFSFSSVGPAKFYLGGELFIDNWDWTDEGEAMFEASQDVHKSILLQAGKAVDLLVESTNEIRPLSKLGQSESTTHKYGGCRIGYQEQSTVNLLREAVEVARIADVALIIVGLDAEWESEGYDRQSMDLPKHGRSDQLIDAVLAVNENTVVINQSGTPVTMPWAGQVPAILQAWYQGQEAGHALADVLFGKHCPGGKLPTTFPKRLEDNPSYPYWPGKNMESVYGEGLFMGYRFYEAHGVEPLFPFGHGLSYTTFEYGQPTISSVTLTETTEKVLISVSITNVGDISGYEIVQAYVRDLESRLTRPEKELKAFDKLYLRPHESRDAELAFDKYSVGYYDDSIQSWIAEQGHFEVLIGASSADIRFVANNAAP
jgi:beta-glucosidase